MCRFPHPLACPLVCRHRVGAAVSIVYRKLYCIFGWECGQANKWYNDNWIEIRVSFGMMGSIFHSNDALVLAEYLIEHFQRRPPDHLMIEWYCAETEQSKSYVGSRVHLTFRWVGLVFSFIAWRESDAPRHTPLGRLASALSRHNLFRHAGQVSTLRPGLMRKFAGCYVDLVEPHLFLVRGLPYASLSVPSCCRRDVLAAVG